MSTETSTDAQLPPAQKFLMFVSRLLLALLFILAGAAKIANAKPFLEHMNAFGIPSYLLPAVITLELGAGIVILIGWRIRVAAAALAVFCLMTAVIFHHQLSISAERTSFFKDLAIAGGLLALVGAAQLTHTKPRT